MVLHALHLCSGYAGFELALRLAGIPARTVAHVERDSYAAAVLVARMADKTLDQAPVWSDLATFDGGPWRGRVDLVTAGLPCQPFSQAGQRRGVDDDRHLWPMACRVIADVEPSYVFLENVPDVVGAGWLPHVLADLADLGFDAEWGLYSAVAVGAPHRRDRFWLLAFPADAGRLRVGQAEQISRRLRSEDVADTKGPRLTIATGPRRRPGITRPPGRCFPPPPDDTDGWRQWIAGGGPQPQVRRRVDGRPMGLADALHLGGNGLVPAVAATALLHLAERAGIDLMDNVTTQGGAA